MCFIKHGDTKVLGSQNNIVTMNSTLEWDPDWEGKLMNDVSRTL